MVFPVVAAMRLPDDLAGRPAKLANLDALVTVGGIGGEQPTAADLQIGGTLRVLMTIGDLQPLIERRPLEAVARRWFPEYPGAIPAGPDGNLWFTDTGAGTIGRLSPAVTLKEFRAAPAITLNALICTSDGATRFVRSPPGGTLRRVRSLSCPKNP